VDSSAGGIAAASFAVIVGVVIVDVVIVML
jgi:hypothetical protein